jgi:hypothetical protein
VIALVPGTFMVGMVVLVVRRGWPARWGLLIV